jgi:hypothetical protein
MVRKFQHRALLYNPITKEFGAVRQSREMDGVMIYEVAVPKDGKSWVGFYLSDWPENALELSDNEELKSSMEYMSDRNLLT